MRAKLHTLVLAALAPACATAPTIADLIPTRGGDAPVVRTGPVDQSTRNDVAAGWEAPRPAEGTPVLYGRDGSPIGAARPGQVVEQSKPMNAGVDQTGGSRIVLLELYEDLKTEHEALVIDCEALQKEHELATTTVAEQRTRITQLEAQLAAIQSRNKELEQAQMDMALRLAQAQIARLEAERALLEASIDWHRMNAANTRAMSGEESER